MNMDFSKRMVLFLLLILSVTPVRSEENIALGKPANQSSQESPRWHAGYAVDGCTELQVMLDCCTITAYGETEAWWQVDLEERSVIDVINVYNRSCPVGRYGFRNCDRNCSLNCQFGSCDPRTGVCFDCIPGKFDTSCQSDCPVNCKNNSCDRETGFCSDCDTGRYGPQCTFCPEGCLMGTCNKYTGACIECVPGKYGVFCEAFCPDTCTNGTCDKENGTCEGEMKYPNKRKYSQAVEISCGYVFDSSFTCNFFESFCNWQNNQNASLKFFRGRGQTPIDGTGPDGGHTTGDRSDYYIYVKDEVPPIGGYAEMFSPIIPSICKVACFRFWYNMHGKFINKTEIGLTDDRDNPLFIRNGNLGKEWKCGSVPITNCGSKKIYIRAYTSRMGVQSQIAFDDLTLIYIDQENACSNDNVCNISNNISTPVTTLRASGVSSSTPLLTSTVTMVTDGEGNNIQQPTSKPVYLISLLAVPFVVLLIGIFYILRKRRLTKRRNDHHNVLSVRPTSTYNQYAVNPDRPLPNIPDDHVYDELPEDSCSNVDYDDSYLHPVAKLPTDSQNGSEAVGDDYLTSVLGLETRGKKAVSNDYSKDDIPAIHGNSDYISPVGYGKQSNSATTHAQHTSTPSEGNESKQPTVKDNTSVAAPPLPIRKEGEGKNQPVSGKSVFTPPATSYTNKSGNINRKIDGEKSIYTPPSEWYVNSARNEDTSIDPSPSSLPSEADDTVVTPSTVPDGDEDEDYLKPTSPRDSNANTGITDGDDYLTPPVSMSIAQQEDDKQPYYKNLEAAKNSNQECSSNV